MYKRGTIIEQCHRTPMKVEFKAGDLITNTDVQPSLKVVRNGENITNEKHDLVHLYLYVAADAKAGDYVMGENYKPVKIQKEEKDSMLLVATTNKEIPLARFSKSFINYYAEKEVSEVLVEHVLFGEEIIPSKNKNNIIQLKTENTDRSELEVIEVIEKLIKEVYGDDKKAEVVEWIKANL
jgi:hypothetical protein